MFALKAQIIDSKLLSCNEYNAKFLKSVFEIHGYTI